MTLLEQNTARVSLGALEAGVTPLTADGLLEVLRPASDLGRTFVIANHNLHSLYLYVTDAIFRKFYEGADLVLIDGFPVLLAAKRILSRSSKDHALTSEHRIGSLDWMLRLDEVAGLQRVALVGASAASNSSALVRLAELHPSIEYAGWEGASWSEEKATRVVSELKDFRPDIVFVGLGMPLQEKFIMRYIDLFPPTVIATVGGAIDQIAGSQKAAPRWLGSLGMEWLWRLASQPRRLGPRYLLEPWKLARILVLAKMKQWKN